MEPLATKAKLDLFLDEVTDPARATELLAAASALIRSYTGNLFDYVEDDVIIQNGTGSKILLLPQAPVKAVSAVVEAQGRDAETELAGPLEASPVWEWDEAGVLERIDGGVFARRRRWYRITLDHGFDYTPDEVSDIAARIAGRGYTNPEGIAQEALGGYSYSRSSAYSSDGSEAPFSIWRAERLVLDDYFISSKWWEGTPPAGSGS